MSATRIVTRTALSAAVAALGITGLLTSPAAHADSCTVNGGALVLNVHPPGLTYTVTVPAHGSTISGPVSSTNKGEDNVAGSVSGGIIAGNAIDFIVDWNPSEGGATHFRGTVGSDGIAHGTATGSSAQDLSKHLQFEPGPWDSTQPPNCGAVDAGTNPAGQPAQTGADGHCR